MLQNTHHYQLDVENENERVSHLLQVDGVDDSSSNIDLEPETLTYHLAP